MALCRRSQAGLIGAAQNIYSSGPRYKLLHHLRTDHSRNIFCAKFVPNTNDTAYVRESVNGRVES